MASSIINCEGSDATKPHIYSVNIHMSKDFVCIGYGKKMRSNIIHTCTYFAPPKSAKKGETSELAVHMISVVL